MPRDRRAHRHLQSVRGGHNLNANVTMTCSCRAENENYSEPCSCTHQKFFQDPPKQYICPRCAEGKHKFTF